MAQVKAMKDAVEHSYTTFRQRLSALTKAATATSSTRTLEMKLSSFTESLDQLNAAHTAWKSKAALSNEDFAQEVFSDTWLQARWDEADAQIDEANDVLHLAIESAKAPGLNSEQIMLEERMKSLQLSIINKIDSVTSAIGSLDAGASVSTLNAYSAMLDDVGNQLNLTHRDMSSSVIAMMKDNVPETVAVHEQFVQVNDKRILDLRMMIVKSMPAEPTINSDHKPKLHSHPRIEIEKCKVPTFSGKTIEYPEFKKSWIKVAGAHWDDTNQLEQMKFKVDSHTKLILSRCKDMEAVWVALDEEYGQEREVVNAVNHELHRLRSQECTTPQFIVNLRNALPTLEEALSAVDGLEHLKTPDKVDFLVEKFDERTQHEWEYYRSKGSGKTYDRFFAFLLDRYDSCRSTTARISAPIQSSTPSLHVDSMNVNRTVVDVNNCVKCSSWIAKGGSHTCPACGHTATEGQLIGHCLPHCQKYQSMSVDQRSKCVESVQWCPIHLSSTHSLEGCAQKSDSRLVCGVNGCTKHHHRSLHGSTTTFVLSVNCLNSEEWETHHVTVPNDVTMLTMQKVSSVSGDVNCFFDDGSTCCLILHSTAKRLGLKGERIRMRLKTVNGITESESYMYYLDLIDTDNVSHSIKIFAVDWIADAIENVSIDGVKELFSAKIQAEWAKVDTRPSGDVEVLIGLNYLGLHPSDLEIRGNLKLKKSKFSSGFVLAGSDPALKLLNPSPQSSGGSFDVSVRATNLQYRSIREYFDSNELHVDTPRSCNSCMKCKDCSYQNQQMSLREKYEYNVMEDNVSYDEVEKVFRIKYPFLEDPSILTYNIHQAIKVAERTEKKVLKGGLLKDVNAEFDKMLALGALVELSEDEMKSWTGPAHWVSLQPVLKPESETTPTRLVTNTSLSDRNGNSVNSILMKGPNSLSDQRAVVSQWRCYQKAISSDVTKAYYAMKTGDLEKHIRRVVWRYGEVDKHWRHFAFQTVSFGDKPAGVFLDIVLRKVACMFAHIDPSAAIKINTDRYVDDIATGGSHEEVDRMVGRCIGGTNKFETDGTLSQILANGSLKLKAVVTSGDHDEEKINKLGRLVLGTGWNPTLDRISIEIRETEVLRNVLEANDVSEVKLTPRILLGIINKPHDILGLIMPITIRAMAAYRDLFRLESAPGWDDDIPYQEKLKWVVILNVLHQVADVSFDRCITSLPHASQCELIGYFDGSDNAYAAVVYIRWTLFDGSYDVFLACSKAKVSPLKRISTPRAELNGAVLLTRLMLFFLRSCISSGIKPIVIWLLGDSECTLASIEKTSGSLGEYFGNRCGEILDNQSRMQELCPVGKEGEWYHVSSKDNAADRPSRLDSVIADIAPDSTWQKGPAYLYSPTDMWPTDRDFAARKESCVPDNEILKKYRGIMNTVSVSEVQDTGVHKLIDPTFTNDWNRLIERTVLFMEPFLSRRDVSSKSEKLEAAERAWFLHAMKDTKVAEKSGRLSNLFCEEKDGMVVVVGRAKHGMQKFFGKEFLPVIVSSSRVAFLIMLWAHNVNHDGRDITMSIACGKAWIIGAKRLASSIVFNCVRCRFLHKLKVQQQMSQLPPFVQVTCPPFTNIGIDLCGTLTVHAMTNKRSTLKVWNVIAVCLNTKAVTMHLAPGYSTEDFFIAYDSHVYDRGVPANVHSDKGSQLVAAGKEVMNVDWEAVARRSPASGTTWSFAPAGAQWRNGAVEIFVKKFKSSFQLLYNKTRLNYAEMTCALKRISCILNDRPLSIQKLTKPQSDVDFLSPITPNMLLTGRSGNRAPVERSYVDDDGLSEGRLSFVEELERTWWYQYKAQYFTSLVPTQKWTKAGRNMCVGDIVLIEYKTKSFPGSYRLGRVSNVEVDVNDGLVRTCTVVYKLVKPTTKSSRDVFNGITNKKVRLPVQRLILILPMEEQ